MDSPAIADAGREDAKFSSLRMLGDARLFLPLHPRGQILGCSNVVFRDRNKSQVIHEHWEPACVAIKGKLQLLAEDSNSTESEREQERVEQHLGYLRQSRNFRMLE